MTLALGIGANTAIFSVLNAVVLRPLPYADPDRLVVLWETIAGNDKRSAAPGNFTVGVHRTRLSVTWPQLLRNFNLTGDGPPERINGATVTSNLMSTLGVSARLGRTFNRR